MIRWLHLSDFHFQALERWERRKTLQSLLRHVEKLAEEGLRPDFVFVTGDVAFSGKPKEYDQAVLFFTALAEKLELEPRERFFFVPGNHYRGRNGTCAICSAIPTTPSTIAPSTRPSPKG